jgi:hypothetical protein
MAGNNSELLSIINRLKLTQTDKSTGHSYVPHLYDDLFFPFKGKKTNILEIGTREGDSLRLWHEYFINAKIYGIDNNASNRFNQIDLDRVEIIFGDGYDKKTTSHIKTKFSIIIDDGSHKLEDMKTAIEIYYPKLVKKGILVLEDVQSIGWIDQIKTFCQNLGIDGVIEYDLRSFKNRYDDLAVVITKN